MGGEQSKPAPAPECKIGRKEDAILHLMNELRNKCMIVYLCCGYITSSCALYLSASQQECEKNRLGQNSSAMGDEQSKAAPAAETLIEEWRKIHWSKKEEDLQYVKDFQPLKEVKQLRVLLYGPTGSGKSSFINSVESTLRGRIAGQALTDTNSGETFTITRQTYKINKGGPETFYPFVFTDLMGIEGSEEQDICVEDIKLDMEGHIKDGYKFDLDGKISEDDPNYNKSPTLEDKVHVLVCVIEVSKASLLSNESKKKMREVRLAASSVGIPQLVVLTKIDEACKEVRSDVKNVYKSKLIKTTVDKISADLGLQPNCIFPVKNYNSEIETDDEIDTLILSAMKRIIHLGEDFCS